MTPIVVSGFPGVGKTRLTQSTGWHDSDSSKFSWTSPGVRDPDFPANYIEHIKGCAGVVLVSSHAEVRKALADANIPFMLVYPTVDAKEAYIQRYKDRGSPDAFIALVEANWDTWLADLSADAGAHYRIEIGPDVFLSDVEQEIRMYARLNAHIRR